MSAGVAAAHAKLESMTPADGSSMAAPPTKVVLTFNEPVGSNGTQVLVNSPSGTNVATGAVQVVDSTVTQPVGAMIEAGKYTVQARVVSADGHPVGVGSTFLIVHAVHAADQPITDSPVTSERSSMTTIVAAALGLLVVIACAVVVARRRAIAQRD